MTIRARRGWRERAAWIALFLVFTPVLIDLARHVATHSWTLYALAFPPLTFLVVRATPPTASRVTPALVAVALGMGIEAIALASGTLRLGRIGFVLCAAAVLLLEGRFRMRMAVLLALCVPVPHWILERTAAALLYPIADALAAISRMSGTPAVALGTSLERASGVLVLESVDAGMTAGIFAFGLVWFGCMRREVALPTSAVLSLSMAAVGVSIHVLATLATFQMADLRDGGERDGLRWIRDVIAYASVAGCVFAPVMLPIPWKPSARRT